MRIVFFGTSPLAATVLDSLVDGNAKIVAVFTKPDREAGRGRRLHASPVKVAAQAHALPVIQPHVWDALAHDALARFRADLGIVVAYGMVLPEAVIDTPRLGCVNLHPSRLPRWRGAAPIARAIEAGDTITGVCLMKLVGELDAGPIVDQRDCPIAPRDTTAALERKLAALGAEVLRLFLQRSQREREHLLASAVPQQRTSVCHAPKLSKAEAEIDWRQTAVAIDRKVRALYPWPIAQTHMEKSVVRIWESRVYPAPPEDKLPGKVRVMDQRLLVHCGQGLLEVKKLQMPGKRSLCAKDFLNGHPMDSALFTACPGNEGSSPPETE